MNGVAETKNIEPIGALVAYDLALGLSLGDIALHHNLTVENVQKIARGNLVQKKVREFQASLEERILDEQAKDPVRAFLAGKGMTFAKTLVSEATNCEEGSNASTRLKAAELGLKFGGRDFGSANGRGPAAVQINISLEKHERASRILQTDLTNIPDYVDG